VLAGLADQDLMRRGLRDGIGRRAHRPPRSIDHRRLLPGHPARWLLTSMAGLLTRGSGLAPPSQPASGQWHRGSLAAYSCGGSHGIGG
jgi:hypothetical protein